MPAELQLNTAEEGNLQLTLAAVDGVLLNTSPTQVASLLSLISWLSDHLTFHYTVSIGKTSQQFSFIRLT